MMFDHRPPTQEQIKRAAAKWQGASSTPCCEDRTAYFETNWRYLPGLRKYVTEQQKEEDDV